MFLGFATFLNVQKLIRKLEINNNTFLIKIHLNKEFQNIVPGKANWQR